MSETNTAEAIAAAERRRAQEQEADRRWSEAHKRQRQAYMDEAMSKPRSPTRAA